MSLIDNDPHMSLTHAFDIRPTNQAFSSTGGLEIASCGTRIKSASDSTDDSWHHDYFMETLYGESIALREVCDYLHDLAGQIQIRRGETIIDGVPHVKPIVGVDDAGELFINHDATQRLFEEPVFDLGTQVGFYKDWMYFGIPPRFEAHRVDPTMTRDGDEVMIAVLPGEPSFADIADGRVAIVANPLQYVLTPDEISLINAVSHGMLDDVARMNGLHL